MKKKDEIILKIEDVKFPNKAYGYFEGEQVVVKNAIPGQKVQAQGQRLVIFTYIPFFTGYVIVIIDYFPPKIWSLALILSSASPKTTNSILLSTDWVIYPGIPAIGATKFPVIIAS